MLDDCQAATSRRGGAHIPVEVGGGDAGRVDAVLGAQRHEVQAHALALLGLQVRQVAVQHACAGAHRTTSAHTAAL